jgi:hypothetical protein
MTLSFAARPKHQDRTQLARHGQVTKTIDRRE